MTQPERIYLDNAATSWPKPPEVYQAVDDYQRCIGAPAGRGTSAIGQEVERRIARCRTRVANLLAAKQAKQIAFGFNGTDVLNIALHGLLRKGDHVVTTVVEHNSVLRPLHWLCEHLEIEVTQIGCNAEGVIAASDIGAAMKSRTRMVAVSHASNVTGAIQPIAKLGQIAQEAGAIMLVDAAQTLGHLPIDVAAMSIDVLAASGHKGLLGPLGTGVLYLSQEISQSTHSLRQGGTGTLSDSEAQPESLPEKFEAGNLNVPGLYGLDAGVGFIESQTLEMIRRHETELSQTLYEGLQNLTGVTVYGPADSCSRVGVVSFNIKGYDPQEVASLLDMEFNLQVRAGLHCAPRMHEALGTQELGGTVRISIGPFNTAKQIHTALTAIEQIACSEG